MATRFSDYTAKNKELDDFIVRRRRPLISQLCLIFAIAFLAIYLTATVMSDTGSRIAFFMTLTLIIGALGWFTVMFAMRNRDLVLATEFQNALLASATQLSTRFCLITNRDGGIVYIDHGFQSFFPHFMQGDSRTMDGLLAGAGVPQEQAQGIVKVLENHQSARVILQLGAANNTPSPIMVTIEPLPRPKGYLLVRGRDYVEKRSDTRQQADQASALLLARAAYTLPQGVLIADGNGIITYVNRALEEWLGYAPGEMLDAPLKFDAVLSHYESGLAEQPRLQDYEGLVICARKDGQSVRLQVRQHLLNEGSQIRGVSAILSPAHNDAPTNADADLSLTQFIAASPLAIARLNAEGAVLECNQSLRELMKHKLPDSGGSFLDRVSDESRAGVKALLDKTVLGMPPERKPHEIVLDVEGSRTASLYVNRIGRDPVEIIAQLIDTSEQKNLEQRFAHSQKMQAVGQLAGGVAHDFNNLLTAMIGFCDLLLMRHPAGDQSFADIMQVKQNANRAANLVRQLLAFSRRQTLQPKMLDIADVLAELSNLIRRLIGENIELKVIHARDLGSVKADQGQLEQVFINLAVNARDAMPGGGKLTIQTSHITIDKAHPIGKDLVPPVEDEAIGNGEYVLVEIIDTGTGIPADLLQKIFEPFFSTKEVGSGTGLGLATVYGIIKQTGGYIYVDSKEGQGTRFSLFLKQYRSEESKAPPEPVDRIAGDDLTGKGTVLLVEDETPVRTFAARALRNKGYAVIEADCGETAIEVMEKQGGEVDIIITDVIMPGINGPAMIEEVAPKFPRVKVIFISGYAEDIFVKSYGSEREFNFLPKPFTLKQLASKVKEVMSK